MSPFENAKNGRGSATSLSECMVKMRRRSKLVENTEFGVENCKSGKEIGQQKLLG